MAGGWESPPGSALRAMEAGTRDMQRQAAARADMQRDIDAANASSRGNDKDLGGFGNLIAKLLGLGVFFAVWYFLFRLYTSG